MRKTFAKVVEGAMAEDDKIVLIIGDIGHFNFKNCFERWPTRCYNVGTCEQSMIGFAAGLALAGFYPIVHTIATFLVHRAFEQLNIDFGYQRLAGLFVSVGASFDYASLGATHMAPTDVPMMKMIPGMEVYVPWDEIDAGSILRKLTVSKRLAYVRLAETEGTLLMGTMLGRRMRQQTGSKGVVIAVGTTLPAVLRACGGKDLTVVYINQVAPVDHEAIISSFSHIEGVVRILIVEPYLKGGLQSEMHFYVPNGSAVIKSLGVLPGFVHHYGKRLDHLKYHGLTTDIIRETANELFELT